MDGLFLVPFAVAAFAGGFVSGFSGFAMGLIVSGVWLHIITPIQTATLIAGYGLLTQGYGIFKLRHALRWQNVWPLTLGSAKALTVHPKVFAVERSYDGEQILVLFNFSAEPVLVPAQALPPFVALTGHGFDSAVEGDTVRLPAYGAFFARLSA